MVARFAVMLDGSPTGFDGWRRELSEHLTCPSCGAHHTQALNDRRPNAYGERTAERSAVAPHDPEDGAIRAPTHHCRDCGHQWVRSGPAAVPVHR
jgi:hypothetical protein